MSDINVTVQDEIVNIDILDTPVIVNVVNSPGVPGAPGQGVPVGGTTGQVLAKSSATNYDTAWVNVSGGAWGTITGTLSNQTDLQNALNAKVPYTGATTNVNLGEYEIKAGQLTLDTSPTGTAAVGTTRWNDTTGVSETTLKGGNVLLRNGVDLVARVVNKVTPNTTLTKAAYQAVRVSGAQGQRLAVAFAQANNDANSADTIGLVIETIPTNQEGFIMTVGQIEGINTTGSLQGETWNDGDIIYLSPTIAGAVTNVKPSGGQHLVIIGYVEYAHANNGRLYIKISNGWELTELHDTDIVTPLNNEALIYESATALWKNKSIATALGYTPANSATTLTINGVTYDLSTSRTWTISAGISGSGASGQVAYWTGTSAQSGSNNLFWDSANGRLGIGTNVPSHPINILSANAGLGFRLEHATPSSASFPFQITTSSDTNYLRANINIIEFFRNGGASTIRTTGSNNDLLLQSFRNLQLAANNGTIVTQIFSTGNVAIQNGGTFTDSGERLQVTGTMKVTGASSFGGDLGFSTTIKVGYTNTSRTITFNDAYSGLQYQAFGGHRFTSFNGSIYQEMLTITGNNASLKIGINSTTPNASAILDVASTTLGFLPPRMTTTQKNAILSPAAGLVVYDTTLNKLCVYTTAWETITSL